MNKISFFILLYFIIFNNIVAQPEPFFHSCHNATLNQQAYSHEPSPEEFVILENSNKRSDSIDIFNYNIYLDVSQVTAKSIKAHTLISFKTKLDEIESMSLDLKQLTVDSIFFNSTKINFNYTNNLIVLFFGQKLPKETNASVEVFYHGIPTKDPVWGGVYFVTNYIYNLGIGLSTTPPNFGKVWFPCFDNFVERTTYDYHVSSVSPTRAYCVGHLVSEDTSTPNIITRHYRMDNEIPTYLSNFAVSDYVVDRSLTTSENNPNLPIDLISRPGDIAKMKSQFVKLPQALDAFEYWFGPYKFERIGFTATTVGAMEHPTNIAYPIGTVTGGTITDNELLYAHEFGHQWWGNLTTLDDARDMWIKEGNAEYCAHLFLEYSYGKERFKSKVRDNLSNIIFNAHLNDSAYLPLSPMPYKNTYGTTTYRKGAAMIHNLRAYLGDSLYKKVCHTIFDSLTGRSMNAYEFRDFINRNSSVNVTNFFDDYIFNPGYLGFYIDSFSQSPILSRNIYFVNIKQKLHHADHLAKDVPLKLTAYDRLFRKIDFDVKVDGESTWVEIETPLNFTPETFLLNENQELNYAGLQDNGYFNSTGSVALQGNALTPSIIEINDTAYINLVHHLVGPSEGTKMPNVLKLSATHFWQVNTITKGSLKMSGRVDYNGSTLTALDYDVLKGGEDSIILVYRKNFTEPWREYTSSTKLKLSPNDKRGLIRIDDMIPGEYSLAYGYANAVNVHQTEIAEFNIYPNPARDKLFIQVEKKDELKYFQVYSQLGKLINDGILNSNSENLEINLQNLAEANYYVLLLDKNKTLKGAKEFVIIK